MSTLPDNEFDLEKLFLPAWAQEEPSSAKYAKYEGRDERTDEYRERRGAGPRRREGPPGRREREGRPTSQQRREPAGDRGGYRQPQERPDRGERRGPPHERREPPQPLPEINVTLRPEEKGVESLARQIKMIGPRLPAIRHCADDPAEAGAAHGRVQREKGRQKASPFSRSSSARWTTRSGSPRTRP